MREVTFNQWCDAIEQEQAAKRAAKDVTLAYFREPDGDSMEYVSRGRVIARSTGYAADDKRYFVMEG